MIQDLNFSIKYVIRAGKAVRILVNHYKMSVKVSLKTLIQRWVCRHSV